MTRHRPEDLEAYACRLLVAAGLAQQYAPPVARTLLAADLFGHTSHGLALLPRYLDELDKGSMSRTATPATVRDNGSNLTIDGHLLPGAAVLHFVLDIVLDRVVTHGLVTASIRRSQHIGCLSAYLERATSRGWLMLLMSSNPWARIVAPFGGARPVYSPNPIACGIPTAGGPMLVDTSMSSISVNRCREYRENGERLPEPYLFSAEGNPSDDPNVLFAHPPGAIRPFGGPDLGYKGFALGLMVEALTSGLGGYGRSDEPSSSSNSVFVLVADPAAFGGGAFFQREMSRLAEACAESAAEGAVRMPGERALAHRRLALKEGVALTEAVASALADRASKLGVANEIKQAERR